MEMKNTFKTACRSRRCRSVVLLLCLIGGCRIFFFSAVFPFFNNVDEGSHFDLVYKYSKGHFPRTGIEDYDPRASEIATLYGTPEYLTKTNQFSGNPLPLWTYPDQQSKTVADILKMNAKRHNHEAGSPPFYYILAGIWYNAGETLGLSDGQLLYWIRFLNIPLFMVLIWLSWQICRICFPEDYFIQTAVPLILTFFPQDMFYSINSDVLSPLLFAIAFFLLIRIYFDNPPCHYYLFAGLTVAAALMTKISNVAMPVLLCIIVILKIKKPLDSDNTAKRLAGPVLLLSAAVIPVAVWLIRNYIVLGDITGSADKIKYLNWSVKPLTRFFDHPIFSISGLSYFLAELTKTFWRGEFVWHLKRIAWQPADWFYVISSAVFFSVCGISLISTRSKLDRYYRFVFSASFLTIGISVLFLVILSMMFDFGRSRYPSQQRPYFVSGRLISCVLLPFLLIYTDGLRRVFCHFGKHAALLIVILIVIGITLSELWLTKDIIASPYNWFGLFKN